MRDSSDQASLEKLCTGFDICIVGLVTGAVAVYTASPRCCSERKPGGMSVGRCQSNQQQATPV